MRKILFIAPIDNSRNGGIASWAKSYINNYNNLEYKFVPVNIPAIRNDKTRLISRFFAGIKQIYGLIANIKVSLKENPDISLAHVTTSGNVGSLRDLIIGKYLHKRGIKCIMHCHYGCVTDDVTSNNLVGSLVRRAMKEYDQIWVLDSASYNTLRNFDKLKDKVFLTPNSIEVPESLDLTPKEYKRVAFIGNLIPSKGLFELIEACLRINVRLDIIGPGEDGVLSKVKEMVGNQMDNKVFLHGRLPNQEAVRYMHEVDVLVLPTYYQSEAFPVSILEAMSLTKMVISCPRAAIPDMLTSLDGEPCGILVEPRSADAISAAIEWCQNNKGKADFMCQKAYEKVYRSYRNEIVFEIYTNNYNSLFIDDKN